MKFIYASDKDVLIIKHEERMLKSYEDIIYGYSSKFEMYDCSLKVGIGWTNFLKKEHAASRLPFKNGYECYIYCRVEKDEKPVRYEDKTGEVDYLDLYTSWNISSISRFFFHVEVCLPTDTSDVIEEMDRLLMVTKELDDWSG